MSALGPCRIDHLQQVLAAASEDHQRFDDTVDRRPLFLQIEEDGPNRLTERSPSGLLGQTVIQSLEKL